MVAHLLGRLQNRPLVKNLLENSAWILADKALRMVVGLWVTGYIARELGQEQFGQIHWALSTSYLFAVFGNLGLDQILNRDISRHREKAGAILKAGFALKFMGSLIGFILVSGLSPLWVEPAQQISFLFAVASLLFMATEVGEVHFHSHIRSRIVVRVRSLLFLVASAARFYFAHEGVPVEYFLLLATLETGLGSLILFALFNKEFPNFWNIKLDFSTAKDLLLQSFPMMTLGVLTAALLRIDSLFIENTLGSGSLGLYSAAIKLVEVFYILPVALVGSSLPALSQALRTDPFSFQKRSRELFALLSGLGWILALALFAVAPVLIPLIYGETYLDSIHILKYYCWSLPFVFSGAVRNSIWLIEGKVWTMAAATGVSVVLGAITYLSASAGFLDLTITDYAGVFVLMNIVSYWILTAMDKTLLKNQSRRLIWPLP